MTGEVGKWSFVALLTLAAAASTTGYDDATCCVTPTATTSCAQDAVLQDFACAFGAPIDTASFRYRVNNGERVANEGWRFAVAYAALFLFSMGHAAFQKCKPDVMVAVMDNGKAIVAPTNRKGSETAEA